MDVHDPTVIESDHGLEQEVCIAVGCALKQMHITDWAEVQREDPVLSAVLDWLEVQKRMDLRTLSAEHASSEEGQLIWQNQQKFTTHQKALYLHSMSKGENEDFLLFIVPKAHWVATLYGCQKEAGHQGHGHTLSLLQEHFGGWE